MRAEGREFGGVVCEEIGGTFDDRSMAECASAILRSLDVRRCGGRVE